METLGQFESKILSYRLTDDVGVDVTVDLDLAAHLVK